MDCGLKALILAGGKGTRMAVLTKDEIPKPMVKICGKPILEHTIYKLKKYNIKDIYISVGHLHEIIENYFKDGKDFGVNIKYIVENEPLGSGGALYYLKDELHSDFLICPGDAILDIDFSKMYDFHKTNDALITLFTHANTHPFDSDLVVVNSKNQVSAFDKKNNIRNYYYKNLVNSGVLICSPKTLSYFKELKKINLEHDFVNYFLSTNRVYSYKSSEYIRDVGTPERFATAEKDILSGSIEQKNLSNKQKAIFLDRDGTINVYKNFICSHDQFELLPNVIEAIKKINSSGYLAIVITNQPVVARGDCTFEELDVIFKKMETLLGNGGAFVDETYFCPHHPDKGFQGEVKELKIDCDCRKPKIGMILEAQKRFNLDLSKCYIVGDTNNDIKMAKNANIKSVRVKTGPIEENIIEADFTANDLLEAVNIIMEND